MSRYLKLEGDIQIHSNFLSLIDNSDNVYRILQLVNSLIYYFHINSPQYDLVEYIFRSISEVVFVKQSLMTADITTFLPASDNKDIIDNVLYLLRNYSKDILILSPKREFVIEEDIVRELASLFEYYTYAANSLHRFTSYVMPSIFQNGRCVFCFPFIYSLNRPPRIYNSVWFNFDGKNFSIMELFFDIVH